MSDQPGTGPTPPGAAGAAGAAGAGGDQPSEEEIRAYLAQLRQADASEIVAQAFSMLASGAEVKLGRRDGRLLIDLAAAVAEAVGERVEDGLRQQMDQAIAQLRTAQVDAEDQIQQLRDEGKLPEEEAGDLTEAGRPAAGEQPAGQEGGEQPGGQTASKLWTPGG